MGYFQVVPPPDSLWSLVALADFMRLSLTERRTRGLVWRCVAGNPGSGLALEVRTALPFRAKVRMTATRASKWRSEAMRNCRVRAMDAGPALVQ
jgi:hypothetical protein